MALRVVTDSTADIPEKLIRQLGITVIPLNLHFGDEILKDGEDIWAEEFFHRMTYEAALPLTSQPSPGEIAEVYRRTSREGDVLLSIHISSQLSGTYNAARLAAESLSEAIKVKVIDSGSVSMALGWTVIEAARACRDGLDEEAVLQKIKTAQEATKIYFSVESLEHLYRTGRFTHPDGSLYNIRPILSMKDGRIITVENFRGSSSRLSQRMLEKIRTDMAGRPFRLAILHADLQDEVERIRESLSLSEDQVIEIVVTSVGPIVGVHSGPGTIGLVAIPELA